MKCVIYAVGVLIIQTVLQNSKNLKELNLSGNIIGDIGTQILTEWLKDKEFLTLVSLNDNHTSSIGAII